MSTGIAALAGGSRKLRALWEISLVLVATHGILVSAARAQSRQQELVGDGVDVLADGVPAFHDPTLLWATLPQCEINPRVQRESDLSSALSNETSPFVINRASLAIASPRAIFSFNPARPAGVCNPYQLLSNIVSEGGYIYFVDNQGPDGRATLWRRPRDANPNDASELLRTFYTGVTHAELVVFGFSVIAILWQEGVLVHPTVIVQLHKDTGEYLHSQIDYGGSNSLRNLRFDGQRYLYWLKDGALKRNDTTDGSVATIHSGPIDRFEVRGSVPTYVQDRNQLSYFAFLPPIAPRPISVHLYTSPIPNASISQVIADDTHWFFVETRPVGPGPFSSFEDRLYRYSEASRRADLLYVANVNSTIDSLRIDQDWVYFRLQGETEGRFRGQLIRVAKDAPAIPVHDVAATGIEVTQGLQNTFNDVPLFADKRTIVRVYAKALTGTDVPGVTASLSGASQEGYYLGTLEPSNLGTKLITVHTRPSRMLWWDSFIFELPRSWTAAGRLTLWATVNPARRVVEDNHENNSTSVQVNFNASPRLHVIYFNFAYRLDGTYYAPSEEEVTASRQFLRRVYPLGEPGASRNSPGLHVEVQSIVDDGLAPHVQQTHEDCVKRYPDDPPEVKANRNMCASHYVHGQLAALRQRLGIAQETVTYGNIAQVPGRPEYFTRGYADGSSGTGPSTVRDYAAHEIGHVLGRAHPSAGSSKCEHSASDPNYPYESALIWDGDGVDRALFGVDFPDVLPGWPTLLLPFNTYDLMSYCRPPWISDYTYLGIRDFLVARDQRSAAFVVPRQAGDWLIVAGTLEPAANLGGFTHIERTEEVADPSLPPAGPFRLELRNSRGGVIASYPFAATMIADQPGNFAFDFVVPFRPGTAELAVVDSSSGRTLANAPVSAHPPVLDTVRLEGAPNPVDGVVTVAWHASDPDGDLLRFDLFATRDGGQTYRPVVLGATGASTELDTNFLGGGENRLRVVASDGVHTASAESAPFVVAPRPPHVVITSPVDGSVVDWAQLVSFMVEIDDLQDPIIPDERIVWSTNRGGVLGTGRWLQTAELPVGENVVEVAVTNSLGATTRKTVTVVVGDALVPRGPTLAVAPQQLAWHVAADETTTQTATLTVTNAGDGELSFDATSDAEWLLLDAATTATDVVAPRSFTVFAYPAGLPVGVTSRATLTFRSHQDPNDIVTVPVMLSRGQVFDSQGALPPSSCPGDCDNSGEVTIDELVRGVNIALENLPVDACLALDLNADEAVTVEELVTAVRSAMEGC